MRLLPRAAAGIALLAAVSVVATVAAVAPADARPHRQVVTKARIVFVENAADPFDGRVVWREWRRTSGAWTLVETKEWRAGSGMGGKAGRNPCVRNVGWLPDGSYRARAYTDYPGHLIHGRAFRLSNRACGNGTVRHNLFVHTESGPGNHQCRNAPGDQPCRWEWPRINDYRSAGCIKMAPNDLAALMRHYRRWTAHARAVDVRRFRLVVAGGATVPPTRGNGHTGVDHSDQLSAYRSWAV